MHSGPHIAWVDGVDAQIRVLRAEDVGELRQGGLARAVSAPAFVRLDGGVTRHVDDGRSWLQLIPDGLRERERSKYVDAVDPLQLTGRIVQQVWLRTRTEDARVVHQRVQAARFVRGDRKRPAVFLVRYVAGDGHDLGEVRQFAVDGCLQVFSVAGVQDQGPAVFGQSPGQREAKAAGGAGNERRAS